MPNNSTFEAQLALRFAPTYISSHGEDRYLVELERELAPKISLGYPPWKPCIYYSVSKNSQIDGLSFYEIDYLSIWDRDTGGPLGSLSSHMWDIERTAILVKGSAGNTDASSFEAEKAYYAAHEGQTFNFSTYKEPPYKDKGIVVYWSLGKHASYPSHPSGAVAIIDQIRKPVQKVEPPDYTLKNAGTINDPTDLAPWINYKDKWGHDGVSSVYSKLKDPLWSPKPNSDGWLQNRPETIKDQDQVRLIQSAMGLKPSGIIDENLFAKANKLSPELIRNTSIMDEDLLAEVAKLRPEKLSPARISSFLKKDVSLKTVISPKRVDGQISNMKKAKAVNLGQLDESTIIYGLVHPEEKKIVEVMTASVATIAKNKIASSELKNISDYKGEWQG